MTGIPHNAWYRGSLEGIPTSDLSRLLPFRKRFSWNVFSQVTLQAKLERSARDRPDESIAKASAGKPISKAAYNGILLQLRRWIAGLHPADTGKTVWGSYAADNTYTDREAEAKKQFVRDFAADTKPEILADIGCNTGDYSIAALDGGAGRVIGFDVDQQAIELAYARAAEGELPFTPLWFDASNPSPCLGWRQKERKGFYERMPVDAAIALAFEHHLAIAHNVPLDQVLDWLIGLAPDGVVEFVPKHDPTIRKMLALREDIFDDYSEEAFTTLLSGKTRILRAEPVSSTGRTLFRYRRHQA